MAPPCRVDAAHDQPGVPEAESDIGRAQRLPQERDGALLDETAAIGVADRDQQATAARGGRTQEQRTGPEPGKFGVPRTASHEADDIGDRLPVERGSPRAPATRGRENGLQGGAPPHLVAAGASFAPALVGDYGPQVTVEEHRRRHRGRRRRPLSSLRNQPGVRPMRARSSRSSIGDARSMPRSDGAPLMPVGRALDFAAGRACPARRNTCARADLVRLLRRG